MVELVTSLKGLYGGLALDKYFPEENMVHGGVHTGAEENKKEGAVQ